MSTTSESYTVKAIDEMASIHHGAVTLVGAELGVESFGIQLLAFPARFPDYPAHDHADDGQEEVYVVLDGSGEFEIDGERIPVAAGQMVRIDPACTRKLWPGDDGTRLLAIGCASAGAYERPADFRLAVRR